MLVLLLEGMYEVSRWDGLMSYDIHNQIHKDRLGIQNLLGVDDHRQLVDLISLITVVGGGDTDTQTTR
jgi:hypothetical protein